MNKSELIKIVRHNIDYATKSQIKEILEVAFDVIMDTTSDGEQVNLWGFGTFTPSVRKAHIGINPKTGESMAVNEAKTIRFIPGDVWHRRLKGEE